MFPILRVPTVQVGFEKSPWLTPEPMLQYARGTPPQLVELVTYKTDIPTRGTMLQDLERNRPMEITPIVGAVAELAALAGVETPTIDTVLALVQLRAQMTGQLPGAPTIELPA